MAQNYCPKCGAEHKAGDKFCSNCGYKFPESSPLTDPTPSVITQPVQRSDGEVVITNVEPLEAPYGAKLKISGQGFLAGNTGIYRVDFNGTPGTIESVQPEAIYVIVPQGISNGPINVYVDGNLARSNCYSYFKVASEVTSSPTTPSAQSLASPSTDMTTTSLSTMQQNPITSVPSVSSTPPPSPSPGFLNVTNIPQGTISIGKIVYTSWDKNRNYEDIFVMKAGQKTGTNLTHDTNYNTNPTWSPDGQFIAFTSTREGNREIFKMNQDGTGIRNLTGTSFWNDEAAWSPKNNKISFNSWRDGNLEIYLMNIDGTSQINLTKTQKDDVMPCWSPDAEKIAFATNREQNYEIFVMRSDGTYQTNLTKSPATEDKDPAWSPDGTKIAYTCHVDGGDEIFVMNSKDGGNKVNLTKNPASDDRAPCWSPDGKKLAFMSNRSTTGEDTYWEICVMNSDGSNIFNLTNNSWWDGFPGWVK